MINMKTKFKNANEAFVYYANEIRVNGEKFAGTKALFNVGFTIENPEDNIITDEERNFNEGYARAEWEWYLTGDPNIVTLGQIYGRIPIIWEKMAFEDGEVNSNYGYQWQRNDQLKEVIKILKSNPETRQATISIYDGKEIQGGQYEFDTPCTYAVQFTIINNKLCMSVYMRSNDLWFGFCVDQYCFSSLQKIVAEELSIETGWYYHHAHNMHLYNNKL